MAILLVLLMSAVGLWLKTFVDLYTKATLVFHCTIMTLWKQAIG